MNKSTEIIQIENLEMIPNEISEHDLPSIIGGQIQKLNDLDESVKAAINKAQDAHKKASSARSKSAGLFKKQAAIESLQDAGYDLAEAVVSGAEAQKISFEFQSKLAEISKFLFTLGVSNIALNRTTVRQLQLKMEGASQSQMSELAKREIINVVKQLKAQEDILIKQAHLEDKTKQHNEALQALSKKGEELDEKHVIHAEKIDMHNELLDVLHVKTETVATKIHSNAAMIGDNAARIEENYDNIKNNAVKISENTGKILSIIETTNYHADLIASIKESIERLEKLQDSSEKKIALHQLEIHESSIENERAHSEITTDFASFVSRYRKMIFIICGSVGASFVISILALIFSLLR